MAITATFKAPKIKNAKRAAVKTMTNSADESLLAGLAGCVLRFNWWTPTRAFSGSETAKVAATFQASENAISNRKRLISNSQMTWKKLGALKTAIRGLWVHYTLPYYLDGVRLMPRAVKDELFAKLEAFRPELKALVSELQSERENICAAAKEALGDLYEESLIPTNFANVFGFTLREISIEPPRHLMHTNSEEYRRELAQSVSDVRETFERFERETWSRLGKLTNTLLSSLSGEQRIFGSQLENIQAEFDRIALLNFEGTEIFRSAAKDLGALVGGVSAEELRASEGLKAEKRDDLAKIMRKYQDVLKQTQELAAE
jgi:hypothetical protein